MNKLPTKCEEIESLLDSYCDSELSDEEKDMVDQHLSACGQCRLQLDEIRRVILSLQKLPKLNASRDFASDIDKLVLQHQKAKVIKVTVWSTLSIASAVALLFVVLKVASRQDLIVAGDNTTQTQSQAKQNTQQDTKQNKKQNPKQFMQQQLVKTKVEIANTIKEPIAADAQSSLDSVGGGVAIATLTQGGPNCVTDSLGITTDEDGLYAFKI